MINFCCPFFPPYLNRMLSPLRGAHAPRTLVVGVITSVGLVSGFAPSLSGRSPLLVFSSEAYAQENVSDQELTNYARAVLGMEPVRQEAYDGIKKIIGSSNVPEIVCHKPESLDALPGNARDIAVNYCNQSKKIVESNNLTITRFNAMTVNLQNDPNLKKRIHDELIRLQNGSASQ